MARIFVNFRNRDGDWAALAIRNTLADKFGENEVFLSSFSIPLAAQFERELLYHASNCDVMLALIGPRWLTITGTDGHPKLGAPDDWVSREIATALAAKRKVVPVMLTGASQLHASDLPPEITDLAGLQGCRLDRPRYDTDMDGLQRDLMTLIPGLKRKPLAAPGPQGAEVSVQVGQLEDGCVTGVSTPAGSNDADQIGVTVDRAVRGKVLGLERRDSPEK
jgi:hypothetical protein